MAWTKKDYFQNAVREDSQNSKGLWKELKKLLPGSQQKNINKLVVNNKDVTNNTDMAKMK